MLSQTFTESDSDYQKTLRIYLLEGGEVPLKDAYELGRKNLADGVGLLDLASVHQQALTALLEDKTNGYEYIMARVNAANRFLNEVLSPFEMSRLIDNDSKKSVNRLFTAMEVESSRLAQRLHDDCAQMLAIVYLELAEISRNGSDTTAAQIEGVVRHLDGVCEQLRGLSHELRPLMLDQLGLIPALRALAGGVSKRTGLVLTVRDDYSDRLAPDIEVALYRAVQEALANIIRHARASIGHIRIWSESGNICCKVTDNGVGFVLQDEKEYASSGLGLLGIVERVRALGGVCKIITAPGQGTELQVVIPI